MRLFFACALAIALYGCDGGSDTDAGAPPPGDGGGGGVDAGGGLDAGEGTVDWVINLVVPGGQTDIQSYIDGASEDALYPITMQFYGDQPDDFDFVYLLSPITSGAGRFSAAHRPAIPEIGINGPADDVRWGSAERLKGVVALRLSDVGNGPTLHETLHYWSMFLDTSFGFGRDATMNFGPHWGVASVMGQHGGFDWSTVRCTMPDGGMPPCERDGMGRIGYTIASFGPASNRGDGQGYATIELYLMGLVPASEVTEPIRILRDANFVEEVPGEERLRFDTDGFDELTMADIIALHGERALASPDERAFRGAFVLVTDAPATSAQMDAARRWSRIFSGEESSSFLTSFEDGTGGRATMDTRIIVP